MLNLLDDALLPQSEEELAGQIAEIAARQVACEKEIASLMQQEDHAAGVFFAAEIHKAKQLKAMLAYQHDVRVAKRNRLRLGME